MIESRTIKGPLASTLVRMWRGTAEVAANADRTIRFLASKDGYCVLDPVSKPEDLCKPIENYDWRPGSVLQIEHAFMKLPMMKELSILVLNALDAGEEKFFLSKSCLHRSLRGHSAFVG